MFQSQHVSFKNLFTKNKFRVVQQNKDKLTMESPQESPKSASVSTPETCGSKNERGFVAGPVWKLKSMPISQLSPISEIALTFGESSISTPTTAKLKKSRIGKWSVDCEAPRSRKNTHHLIVQLEQRFNRNFSHIKFHSSRPASLDHCRACYESINLVKQLQNLYRPTVIKTESKS